MSPHRDKPLTGGHQTATGLISRGARGEYTAPVIPAGTFCTAHPPKDESGAGRYVTRLEQPHHHRHNGGNRGTQTTASPPVPSSCQNSVLLLLGAGLWASFGLPLPLNAVSQVAKLLSGFRGD